LERVMMIYYGIHYVPLALTFDEGLPEDADVTIFSVADEYVIEKAHEVAKTCKEKKQFTDTTTFTLQCLVCYQGVVGQEGAMQHAKETGHANFAEFQK